MLVIVKCITVMLSSSINAQFLDHFKSSLISQLIKSKSTYIQRLQRYLSWIVTSVFKAGSGSSCGHGVWFPSRFGGGCAGHAVVFPFIFVILNDLPSEILTPSISSL